MQGRDERRESGRACTFRRARVRRRGERGDHFEAVVLDIAPFGLRMRCRAALAPGDELDIEVYPRQGLEAPIEVRGQVRHMCADGADLLVGLQLTVTLGGGVVRTDTAAIQAALQALRTEMGGMDSRAVSRLHFQPEESAAPAPVEAVDSAPSALRNSARKRWGYGLLLLLLLLLLGIPPILIRQGQAPGRQSSGEDAFARLVPERALPVATKEMEMALPVALPEEVDWQERSWRALSQGAAAGELRGIAAEVETTPSSPGEAYVKRLLLAQLSLQAGDREAVEAVSRQLEEMEQAGTAPEIWLPVSRRIQAYLAGESVVPLEVPRPAMSFTLEAAPIPQNLNEGAVELPPLEAVQAPNLPVRLEIDASDHALHVWRGEEKLASFPVGLGADGATPLGEFEIVNKISNPDWYNRGEVVPHGDPRNPLGAYWMGLGGSPESVGVGIHPTKAADSIGGNESRGCIRMYAADAGRVFAWCDVGTVVSIHP
jgi:lipoprotein-anchoring transpeptidase ErfK/SrfK